MDEKNCKIKEIYSDGIGKIHYFGNMIRLDLISFQPSENEEDEKPVPTIVNRLVMPPNAFLASYESFVNMIEKLKDAGILAKNEETSDSDDSAEKIAEPSSTEEVIDVDTEK